MSGFNSGIQTSQSSHKLKHDICQIRNREQCDKQPMKRKRRHTTEMEDLLTEDEDRPTFGPATNDNISSEAEGVYNAGLQQSEETSEMLSRELSKMQLNYKHRKSKRRCTRY